MAEEEKRHLAYLEDMYEDRKGQKKVKVRWFHHNQEVQGVVTLRNPHPKEVFITPYAQVISVECVDGPAIVLTREHYDKSVSILPEDLLTRVHLCLRQFKNNRVKPFKLSKLCGYFDQPIFSILETDFLEDEEHSLGDNNVKVGGKRPRSSRGRQAVVPPYDPSCMKLKYEMLRRRLIPKYVKNHGLNTPFFKVNEKIEVLCQDSGIRGCWFRCTVLQFTRKRLKVQYDDLKDVDGGGNLEEWVSALRLATPDKLGMRYSGRPTMRPARLQDETNAGFEVGSPVDGWWSDGWWEGVVTGVGDESGDGIIRVYVPSETLFLELHTKDIRVSKDWTGDHWVDLETKPDIHSLMPPEKTSPDVDETKHESLPSSSKETPPPASNDHPPENDTPLQADDETDRKPEVPEKENDPNPAHDDTVMEIPEKGLDREADRAE